MVFRGRPSKACERCRSRRLKCDLKIACGPCLRANVICAGYRAENLRVVNITPDVLQPRLDVQAQEAFFTYLVPSISQYWEFLKRLYFTAEHPKHLNLAIEAVSLAYLWHQVYSDAALATAQKRYISSLQALRQIIRVSGDAPSDATLLAVLLLDLFEKITGLHHDGENSWMCHVKGGLSLVRLRHLEKFENPFSLRILVRFITNNTTSAVVRASKVPGEITILRAFIANHVDCRTPHWQLQDLLVRYAELRSMMKEGVVSSDGCIKQALVLDTALEDVENGMLSSSWEYSTITMPPGNLGYPLDFRMDIYRNRSISQSWNGLRLVRILLNESILQNLLELSRNESESKLKAKANKNINRLANEICASAPQYVSCEYASRGGFFTSSTSQASPHTPGHFTQNFCKARGLSHTPDNLLDCYTLIFPLYVAGRSMVNPEMRRWVVKKLNYLGSHFHIRHAKIVADILDRGTDIDPWEIYAITGSYAFAA